MTKEDRKNAYLYCKFRDEQFALYDEYAKRHGMMMKTLLVVNVLFYAKEGLTQTEICQRTFQSKQTVNVIIKSLLDDQYVTIAETLPVTTGVPQAIASSIGIPKLSRKEG